MKLRWPMQQFQEIMYTNSLWTILSIISIVQRHILTLHFVYWIILKKTILNLLDPSSTTSLVGKVIVCSLGEMSARGGLFTRGAKQVYIQNEQERESEHISNLCQKDHSKQRKIWRVSSDISTQDKLAEVWGNDHDQVVIGFKLLSDWLTRGMILN